MDSEEPIDPCRQEIGLGSRKIRKIYVLNHVSDTTDVMSERTGKNMSHRSRQTSFLIISYRCISRVHLNI